jgi:2-dehydro-3-deoxygluconokinase
VIITLGARGALALEDGRLTPAKPGIAQVVDPVGAGDAFAAGFLAARLRGERLEASVALGVERGALATASRRDVVASEQAVARRAQ